MPTRQNANRTKCQPFCPDFFLWLAFCPTQFLVGILSRTSPQHVLALCPNHEKCRHALSIKDLGLWIPWGHHVGLVSFDDKSYVPVYKWSRFFWQTNWSTGSTGCLKKLSFTDLSISRLDLPLRATLKIDFFLVISYTKTS